MSTINVSCVDQVLALTNTPVIASGGIKEDYVSFQFCPLWDGFYKVAVFWRSKEQAYHVVLDETNTAQIPNEVLAQDGVVYFGVLGTNDSGVQRTSAVLRYTIVEGAITESTEPPEPTPDIYQQILAKLAEMGDNKGKADKVGNATAGNLAALDANGNLTDSGKKAGDFITKNAEATAGNLAAYDTTGNLQDSGKKVDDFALKSALVQAEIGTTWTGESVPKSQVISVPGVTASSVVEISLQDNPTTDQVSAWNKLGLQDGGQAAGQIILLSYGTVNTIALPVNIIVRGDM